MRIVANATLGEILTLWKIEQFRVLEKKEIERTPPARSYDERALLPVSPMITRLQGLMHYYEYALKKEGKSCNRYAGLIHKQGIGVMPLIKR
jgi:hypothetical protein